MKMNATWKTLTRDQKKSWSTWAKNNAVLLPDGQCKVVAARKAFTIVLQQRGTAGVALTPTVVPAAFTWLTGQFSLRDNGPFTSSTGYVGLRCEANLLAGTKWFVWATPPVLADEGEPRRMFRLVKVLSPGAMAENDVTANLATEYRAVCGEFNGPGADGAWDEGDEHYVWFRICQYANGQLGPATVARAMIVVEL